MNKNAQESREVGCVSCGKTMHQTPLNLAEGNVPQCAECLERARERPGFDYDLSELGGEG